MFAEINIHLNEMLDASLRLAPAGPRSSASKIAAGDFVRTNPQDADLRWASTPKGCASWMAQVKNLVANPGRSPLMHSYGYASADDRPALFVRAVPNQRVLASHPCWAVLTHGLRGGGQDARSSFVPSMQYTG